jgi:enoyl-CoA hydratase/carnithine racemase
MGTIRTDDHDSGVRVLTLDRPPANAEDETLLRELGATLDAARDDDRVRAIVLTGAGRFFGGGMDLAAPGFDADGGVLYRDLFRDVHLALLTFPKPTVAMLNGTAVAGGLILVLACDYRLGVEGDYRIGLTEVAIGIAFPRIALEIVRLRLTHARASELVLGAALYPASQAVRLGVVDELLPADRFRDTVLRRAARLGTHPREAYAHTKALLVAPVAAAVRAESDAEAAATRALWTAAENRAVRTAHFAKIRRSGR